MNQLQYLTMLTLMHTAPIQQQTYYVANLSSTDGAKPGEYVSVTPMNPVQIPVQPIMPLVMPMPSENEGE